ncbi:hypothetical protein OSB04_031441 [Centaurea solstitialis]|uniref:Uncharacterized protein n=1 Tax=Centaurea solstitialis TaxID=347529 RepID=A0AA38SAC9_9ASTR|nr:hypothetical protein OSB04_031441 [Centaurea solstitialis]
MEPIGKGVADCHPIIPLRMSRSIWRSYKSIHNGGSSRGSSWGFYRNLHCGTEVLVQSQGKQITLVQVLTSVTRVSYNGGCTITGNQGELLRFVRRVIRISSSRAFKRRSLRFWDVMKSIKLSWPLTSSRVMHRDGGTQSNRIKAMLMLMLCLGWGFAKLSINNISQLRKRTHL